MDESSAAAAAAAAVAARAAVAAQSDAAAVDHGQDDDVLDDHLWRWRFHRRWAAAQRGLAPGSVGNSGGNSAGGIGNGGLLAEELGQRRGGAFGRQASSGLFSMLSEDD